MLWTEKVRLVGTWQERMGEGAHTSHDPPRPWRLGGGDWSHRLMRGSLQIVREEQPEAGSKYWSFPVVLIYNFPDGYRN